MLTFQEGERILCFHGPLIYEAKVVKAEMWTEEKEDGPGPHYYVHYKGWKQTWDEWVPELRVLKFNEENLARQKGLIEAQRAKDRAEKEEAARVAKERDAQRSHKKGESHLTRDRESTGGSGSRKRGRDSVAAEEEEYLKRPEIKVVIPDALKIQLVDDWENVTRLGQLVPLPRNPNVQEILRQYEEHAKAAKTGLSINLTREVLSGLQLYFDKSLGNNLLYRFERTQYSDIRKKNSSSTEGEKEMSAIYGAEHLLRLFVNLPEMIAHTNMDAHTVAVLKEHLMDFLKWMAKEQKRLFVDEYENTSPQYQNVART